MGRLGRDPSHRAQQFLSPGGSSNARAINRSTRSDRESSSSRCRGNDVGCLFVSIGRRQYDFADRAAACLGKSPGRDRMFSPAIAAFIASDRRRCLRPIGFANWPRTAEAYLEVFARFPSKSPAPCRQILLPPRLPSNHRRSPARSLAIWAFAQDVVGTGPGGVSLAYAGAGRLDSAALAGVDVMGQARTGTGKTAAFLIPILERLDEPDRKRGPQAPVLVPNARIGGASQRGSRQACLGKQGAHCRDLWWQAD